MSAVNDPKANGIIFKIDADFGEAAVRLADPLWSLTALTDKQKSFLCLTTDICRSWLGLPFMAHLKMAFRQGAYCYEIKELLLQIAPYASFPTTLSALIHFKIFTIWRRFKERRANLPTPIISNCPDFNALMPANLPSPYREHFNKTILPLWQRPGLDFETRILMVIACDISHQTLGEPLKFHINAAKAAGVNLEKIRQTVFFVSEYAFSKSWNALLQLEDYLS